MQWLSYSERAQVWQPYRVALSERYLRDPIDSLHRAPELSRKSATLAKEDRKRKDVSPAEHVKSAAKKITIFYRLRGSATTSRLIGSDAGPPREATMTV
jgi:hypothetical protein